MIPSLLRYFKKKKKKTSSLALSMLELLVLSECLGFMMITWQFSMTEKVHYAIGWSSIWLFCGSKATLADPTGRIVKPLSMSSWIGGAVGWRDPALKEPCRFRLMQKKPGRSWCWYCSKRWIASSTDELRVHTQPGSRLAVLKLAGADRACLNSNW